MARCIIKEIRWKFFPFLLAMWRRLVGAEDAPVEWKYDDLPSPTNVSNCLVDVVVLIGENRTKR